LVFQGAPDIIISKLGVFSSHRNVCDAKEEIAYDDIQDSENKNVDNDSQPSSHTPNVLIGTCK